MSNIRVTYSGLIAFLVTLIGVITGTIFVVLVTRRLSPDDFGLWTLIGSIVTYVTIVEPIITYWTTRQIARGEEVGKTALATNSVFSIGGFAVFLIIAFFISQSLLIDFNIFLIAAILIPISFINNALNSICRGFKPQAISFGSLGFEIVKIPIGFFLIVSLELGIIGAIVTTIASSLIKTIILIIYSREQLIGTIKREVIKFWLRMSWLTVYMSIQGLIYKLDVLVFSLLTNSLLGLAFWGVSSAASNFVSHAGTISQGLYPKIIATRKKDFVEENLKRTLYFLIPIMGASIIFAKPALHILNPIYIAGVSIVIILAIRAVVNVLNGFYFSLLESYENIDAQKQANFKQFVKSKLFLIPTLRLIFSGIYVTSLAILLILTISDNLPEAVLVTYWSLLLLFSSIPFMLYGMISVRRKHGIGFPSVPAVKYGIVTLFTSLLLFFISEKLLTYPESVWDFLPEIIPLIILGGVLYFGITYLIDESVRKLFKSILKEIGKNKF